MLSVFFSDINFVQCCDSRARQQGYIVTCSYKSFSTPLQFSIVNYVFSKLAQSSCPIICKYITMNIISQITYYTYAIISHDAILSSFYPFVYLFILPIFIFSFILRFISTSSHVSFSHLPRIHPPYTLPLSPFRKEHTFHGS